MKYLGHAIFILILAVIVTLVVFLIDTGPKVFVQKHPDYQETYYSLTDKNGDKIQITLYHTEINRSVLRLRSGSKLPLTDQIRLLSRILDRVFKDIDKSSVDTLFVGRLISAFGEDMTMSRRLAQAASTSPLWNKDTGRAMKGHENPAAREIANQAHIYTELAATLNKHGFIIRVSDMEKVLVFKAKDTLYSQELLNAGIGAQEKLPIDALTWFSITPAEPGAK
ncbi:MAG: hypothetical protein JW782_03395 [Candidatus Saganbacteria bacterium]|nr:hypothetical protein [Candidatus Saganbacteria bacterium]